MSPISAAALERRWLHAHEEDSAGHEVFRPAGYAFPPSRGRRGFELQPGGHLVDLGIGAADGTVTRSGTWSLSADDTLTLTVEGRPAERYTVVSVAPDRLVLARQR